MSAENRPPFIPIPVNPAEPTRCIDDRPDPSLSEEESLGPQMPGADLTPIVIACFLEGKPLDEESLGRGFSALETAGYGTAVHRGSHKDPDINKSDCGFADLVTRILENLVTNRNSIEEIIQTLPDAPPPDIVTGVFSQMEEYLPYQTPLSGEPLISAAENCCSEVLNVEGDHNATRAIINYNQEQTFNTQEACAQGQPAFSMDINAAVEKTKTVFEAISDTPFDEDYNEAAKAATAGLFISTLQVLVPGGIDLYAHQPDDNEDPQ